VCIFCFVCVLGFFPLQLFSSVLWYCWLGLLTCKNRLPYNLYCVGGDVKHCSINQSIIVKYGIYFMVPTVREKSGNFKRITLQKFLKSTQNKTTYTFMVMKLIIHMRYSVHAIHTPSQSKTVWFQPWCSIFYSVTYFCCWLMHLLLVYLVSRVHKLVRENNSFCL